MMHKFMNSIRREALMMQTNVHIISGIVTSYNPNKMSAVCLIQPVDDTENEGNFLSIEYPIASHWVGNQWGLFTPPTPGNLAIILIDDNSENNAGQIIGFLWNQNMQPLPVPAGECWLVHQSGSKFKLTNDGKINIGGQVEIDASAPTINITATGNVNINAVNANVTASAQASVTAPNISLGNGSATLNSLVNDSIFAIYNGHTHVDSVHGTTSGPSATMSSSNATNVVKGA